jgi:uncharacterized membrane protein
MGKTMKILISSSLLLNVLLIGVVIGSISNRLFKEDFPKRRPPELTKRLPPDKETLFMEVMAKVDSENREVHRQIEKAREKVLSVLSAPEFDEAAFQAETTKLDELHGLIMQRFAKATNELAKQMNQEERKGLAEIFRRPPPPPPPRELGPPTKGGPPGPREGPLPGRVP